MSQETEERTEQTERTERVEQPERAAPPRFSESESPPAWLIATRGDLREMESRVNYRIDDAKTETNTRINDAKAETSAQIGATNARIDELKADGRARDAKLDSLADALARIESKLDSDSRRKQLAAAWIGIAVGALGIAAGVLWNIVG